MSGYARYLGALLATTGMSIAMLTAAPTDAAPQCTNTGPNTTLCQTNGSTQIVTTPAPISGSPGWGWGWGIGFGGFPIVW